MTHDFRRIIAFTALISAPSAMLAQTVDEVFEGLIEAENAGYQAVDNYVLKTNTLGMSTFEYYEKVSSITLDNGQTVYVMRNVPPNEISERQSETNALSNASPTELRNAALAIEDGGRQMEQGMMDEMQGAGLPGGIGNMLMNPPPDEPWLSANPRDMTSMYAMMLRGAADAKEEQARQNPVGDAQQHAQNMDVLRSKTRITGRREFNGIDAIELTADNIDHTQISDGQEFTLNSVRMLVDATRHVPLLLTMDGVISDGRESRPMTIEREDRDYRNVPGCGDMYRPFKSVMRLGGVMTPEEQAELAEASVQLEEFEAQMASMPASQRKMMESMMGPQLEMIRSMASGGGIEIESTIAELRCNTGLPNPMEIAQTTFGSAMLGGGAVGGAGSASDTDAGLLRRIQVGLGKKGYTPGNTNGDLDKPTVVAISQFQAANGMDVTGRPSPQLVGVLEAESAGLSKEDLTTDYLEGHWCTEQVQERSLYKFAADGSYRLGVVGLTITQMDGINYFPETYSRQNFFDEFERVGTKDKDRFSMIKKGGYEMGYTRGNCFE
jgi:hypothetical protein